MDGKCYHIWHTWILWDCCGWSRGITSCLDLARSVDPRLSAPIASQVLQQSDIARCPASSPATTGLQQPAPHPRRWGITGGKEKQKLSKMHQESQGVCSAEPQPYCAPMNSNLITWGMMLWDYAKQSRCHRVVVPNFNISLRHQLSNSHCIQHWCVTRNPKSKTYLQESWGTRTHLLQKLGATTSNKWCVNIYIYVLIRKKSLYKSDDMDTETKTLTCVDTWAAGKCFEVGAPKLRKAENPGLKRPHNPRLRRKPPPEMNGIKK